MAGVRIADMPDLGAVDDTSSVVGERAGSGRFAATALRDYMAASLVDMQGLTTVRQFGAKGDGTTDDAAAINAASVWLNSQGGGILFFPAGTYAVGSTCVLYSHVTWQGSGSGVTIIKGLSGTTMDVLQTYQFATLTGTNVASGPLQWAIKQMTIDGNKAGRTAGRCAAFYGYDFVIEDVVFQNAHGDCVYSEWCTDPGVPVAGAGGNGMESHWSRVKTWGSAVGNGLTFYGPHDSHFTDYLTFINGAYGVIWGGSTTYTGIGCMVTNCHSYGNTGHGIVLTTEIFATNFESESNQGSGIVISNAGTGGQLQASNVFCWANHGNGFYVETSGNWISNLVSQDNTNAGVYINANQNMFSDVVASQNAVNGVFITSNADNTMINNAWLFQNTGDGITVTAKDCCLTGITSEGNSANGVSLSNAMTGLMLQGKMLNNSSYQISLGAMGGTSNTIDADIYTNAGQTAYTGSPANNSVRLNCAGAQFTYLNNVPDAGTTAGTSNTVTKKIPVQINGTTYYLLASTSSA